MAVIRAIFARWFHSIESGIGKRSVGNVADHPGPTRTLVCSSHSPPGISPKAHLNKLPLDVVRKVLPIVLVAGAAYAGDAPAYCWDEAGNRYRISAAVLQSIGRHESGLRPTAVNRNANGTVDVGLMQINSVHFAELRSFGISPDALWDPCTNVMVGAFLLARSIQKYGNTWEAVGGYHSRTPGLKERYALQVYHVFARQAQPPRAPTRARTTDR